MAIKVNGTTVVNDSRKLAVSRLNPGIYTEDNQPASGNNPGDFYYDSDNESLVVWTGSEWK